MSKFIPHKKYYDWLIKIGELADALLYVTTIISVIRLSLEIFNQQKDMIPFFDCILTWTAVIYLMADMFQGYLFYKAEFCRKLDFIDNSLDSQFSIKNSEGYYSNDEFQAGLYKLGVNGFENAFFTMSVSEKMLRREALKTAVILILIITICIVSVREIISLVFQSALIASIFWRTIKLYILNRKVTEIFLDYKATFTTTTKSHLVSRILKNVLFYEKILSWAGITLDNNIFNKMNDQLSSDWEIIKKNHCKIED